MISNSPRLSIDAFLMSSGKAGTQLARNFEGFDMREIADAALDERGCCPGFAEIVDAADVRV